MRKRFYSCCRVAALALVGAFLLALPGPRALAHPLGNFSINHFARLELGGGNIQIRYVIDIAEIPTFQELQKVTGKPDAAPTKAELDAYLERVAASYLEGVVLLVDSARVPLTLTGKSLSLNP